MDLSSNTIGELQQALLAGEISCRDVVCQCLDNIDQHRHLNAIVADYAGEALQRAEALDQQIKRGQNTGKLTGVVLTIKDNICHKGKICSAGSAMLRNFRSLITATAVARLEQEGAIIIGSTNCDEFGMGSSSEYSVYGPVHNGIAHERVAGGSSGGAAVAVQMGMCHAALGSDTGGSIRQPASFCGITGLKPTYGRVSRYGLIAYASSFDQIGPLAQHIDDIALLIDVISGHDPKDSTTTRKPLNPCYPVKELTPEAIVGYFPELLGMEEIDAAVRNRYGDIIQGIRNAGMAVRECALPLNDLFIPVYYVLATAEASSNLARYDGIRYGESIKADDYDTMIRNNRSRGFGAEVKRRILLGSWVLSAGYYDACYRKAQVVRRLITRQFNQQLQACDVLFMPTTPSTAFKIGEKSNEPAMMYLEDLLTVPANLTGLPAISLPLGIHANGLPFGMQLIGRAFEEDSLLSFARWLMDNFKPGKNEGT